MSEHQPLPREEQRSPGGSIEHPRVSYQRDKPHVIAIFALMAVAIAYAALNFFGVWRFFEDRERAGQVTKRSVRPPSLQPGDTLPVEPRLEQVDRLSQVEQSNVRHRFLVNEASLDSYGPTKEAGFVHVPIGRAMEHLAGRLPVRKQSAAASGEPVRDQGLIDAGDSNSGRMFRGRP